MKYIVNFLLLSICLLISIMILLNDTNEHFYCGSIHDLSPENDTLVKNEFTISGKGYFSHIHCITDFDSDIKTKNIYDISVTVYCYNSISTIFHCKEYILNGNGDFWNLTLDTRNFDSSFQLSPSNFYCELKVSKFYYDENQFTNNCTDMYDDYDDRNRVYFRYDNSK